MSERRRRFDDEGHFEGKKDAKQVDRNRKDIEKLFRLIQRGDSRTATQNRTTGVGTSNPQSLALNDLKDVTDDFANDGALLEYRLATDDFASTRNPHNLNSIIFDLDPTVTPAEGTMAWNSERHTVDIYTNTGAVIQVGQEEHVFVINKTANPILNGQVVYIMGADSGLPQAVLAQADAIETSQTTLGIATVDIAVDAAGQITTQGEVRDLDTSLFTAGDQIWLSPTVAGGFTNVRPSTPDFVVSLGLVEVDDPSDGVLFFKVNIIEDFGFFNGTFVQTFDFTVASDGVNVTGTLERAGGGNLTMTFSDGRETLITDPALDLDMTTGVGTATVPKKNYVFILQSNKTLTFNTTGFPDPNTTEHIKVSTVTLLTAGITQLDGGPLEIQNINDHGSQSSGQGHLSDIGDRIRHEGAIYNSGVLGNGTTDYITLSVGNAHFKSTAGIIYQMHRHTFPLYDQSAGDPVYIVNDFNTPYLRSTNLFDDITADSLGNAIGPLKHFNITLFGVGNKTGQPQFVMCNLPGGSYVKADDATLDVEGFDNFDMPREFTIDSSTGFLIVRLTLQRNAGGTAWTYVASKELLGKTPQTAPGAGSGAVVTSFADNVFDVHDPADPTKIMVFDVGTLVATGNTRIMQVPDKNITLIDTADAIAAVEAATLDLTSLNINTSTAVTSILDEDAMGSDLATALATQQSIKKYVDDQVAGGGYSDAQAIAAVEAEPTLELTNITMTTSISSILDEDDMSSDSATALVTQQSMKKYVDDEVAGGVGVTLDKQIFLPSTIMYFVDGVGSSALSGATGKTYHIITTFSGNYQSILVEFKIPINLNITTQAIDFQIVFSSTGTLDASVNNNWWCSSQLLTTSEIAVAYNVLSNSAGTAFSVSANTGYMKLSAKKTVTDADLVAGADVGVLLRFANLLPTLNFHGILVTLRD